jgi:hypothetical protein
MLAMFVAVITPALLICQALGLPAQDTQHIISMSLFAPGFDLNNGGHAGGEQRHADDMLGILRRETESLAA